LTCLPALSFSPELTNSRVRAGTEWRWLLAGVVVITTFSVLSVSLLCIEDYAILFAIFATPWAFALLTLYNARQAVLMSSPATPRVDVRNRHCLPGSPIDCASISDRTRRRSGASVSGLHRTAVYAGTRRSAPRLSTDARAPVTSLPFFALFGANAVTISSNSSRPFRRLLGITRLRLVLIGIGRDAATRPSWARAPSLNNAHLDVVGL